MTRGPRSRSTGSRTILKKTPPEVPGLVRASGPRRSRTRPRPWASSSRRASRPGTSSTLVSAARGRPDPQPGPAHPRLWPSSPALKRRTMAWARQNEAWKGLERFLDDFSDFQEIPAEAYKLWEHYLVFGILFGYAKKILKMLPVILQDEPGRRRRSGTRRGFGPAGRPGPSASIAHVISRHRARGHGHPRRQHLGRALLLGRRGGFSGGGGGGGGGGRRRRRGGTRLIWPAPDRGLAATALSPDCWSWPAAGRPTRTRIRELARRRPRPGPKSGTSPGLMAASSRPITGISRAGTADGDRSGSSADHLDRYRGVVVHLLGAAARRRSGPTAGPPVEFEIALSHGAAEVLRKLIRWSGEIYRFGGRRAEGPAGENGVSPTPSGNRSPSDGLFPESLAILKELFPGL
ncbi:MAG: DUF2207 domain-containing protein [Candidatus Moduliflexus flocculans]|nr:DUF2207 domain-containing protein [Candidatus Moduliflexus flocculans]